MKITTFPPRLLLLSIYIKTYNKGSGFVENYKRAAQKSKNKAYILV